MKSLPILVALMAICATSVAVTSPRKVPTFELRDRFKTEPFNISVDDLELPIRSRAEFKFSVIPDDVMQLNGKRVRMIGQMFRPLVPREVKEFAFNGDTERETGPALLLLEPYKAPLEYMIMVSLKDGTTTKSTGGVIQVEGRLSIDAKWSKGEILFLYKIEDATIRPAEREDGFNPSLITLPVYTC